MTPSLHRSALFGRSAIHRFAQKQAVSLRKVPASEAQMHSASVDGMCAPVGGSLHPGHDVFEVGGDTGLTTDDLVLGELAAEM